MSGRLNVRKATVKVLVTHICVVFVMLAAALTVGSTVAVGATGEYPNTAYLSLPESHWECVQYPTYECRWNAPFVKEASLYPSPIAVASLAGTVTTVSVTLHGLTDRRTRHLELLLVGPSGQSVVLMRGMPGGYGTTATDEVTDQSPIFADAGEKIRCEVANVELASLSYQPFSCYGWDFQEPAPAKPYGSALSVFNGTSPDGTWSLYAQHESGEADGATVADGWSLHIETQDPPPSNPPETPAPGPTPPASTPAPVTLSTPPTSPPPAPTTAPASKTPTTAQLLARAIKKCGKVRAKRRRAACIAAARRRYTHETAKKRR